MIDTLRAPYFHVRAADTSSCMYVFDKSSLLIVSQYLEVVERCFAHTILCCHFARKKEPFKHKQGKRAFIGRNAKLFMVCTQQIASQTIPRDEGKHMSPLIIVGLFER